MATDVFVRDETVMWAVMPTNVLFASSGSMEVMVALQIQTF
jgi:hypothetical protein